MCSNKFLNNSTLIVMYEGGSVTNISFNSDETSAFVYIFPVPEPSFVQPGKFSAIWKTFMTLIKTNNTYMSKLFGNHLRIKALKIKGCQRRTCAT